MTAVLDDFNTGATQSLSARAGWDTGHWSGTLDLQTDAVPTYATSGLGVPAGNMWAANLTTDHEVMFTYGSTLATVELVGRANSSSAPSAGYTGRVTNFGSYEIDTRAGATLTSGSGATPGAGDSFRLGCFGTLLTLDYRPSGGAWTQILSVVDSTHTTGTFIGIHVASGGPFIDEFGGGAVVSGAPPARDTHTAIPFTQGAGGGGLRGGPH